MATHDLLTLAEAKEALNIDAAGGSGNDAEIGRWITAVSIRVDELCGPVVIRTVTGELHDGGRTVIRPRYTPVASVTSLVEYVNTTATTLTAETNDTKPEDGYMLLDRGGKFHRIVRRSSNADTVFPTGRRNVVLTYTAGRADATASVDEKFKTAAGTILRRLWQREAGSWARGGDPFADAGVGTVGFFKAIDPHVRELLADELRELAVG